MADFRINVIVDPSGAVRGSGRVRNELDRTSRSVDRLRNLIAGAFAFVGIGALTRQLVGLSDSFTNIQNRIRVVTSNTQELNAVTDRLFSIAQNTRLSFEATTEVYSRTALAVRDLGISQEQTLQFTESLNQAVILSGASAQEAQAGLIQLSQGLASGALRGDELRSVLEQLPVVSDVIAESLGVTRGELRDLGSQGRITADIVLNAFAEAREELEDRFGQTIPTIGQAFTILRNDLILTVGAFNQATGAGSLLAAAIILLSNNLETVLRVIGAVSIALATTFAVRGVGVAIGAVRALTIVIAANPIGAIAIGITAAVSALIAFSDVITTSADGLVNLQDFGVAAFQVLSEELNPLISAIGNGFTAAVALATAAFASIGITFDDVLSFGRSFINRFIGLFVGVGRAVQSIFSDVRDVIVDALGANTLRAISQSFLDFVGFLTRVFGRVRTFIVDSLELINVAVRDASEAAGGIDIPDTVISPRFLEIGANARDAFLSGYRQDFVGELEGIVNPALDRINQRAAELAAMRLAEQIPEGTDVDLTRTTPARDRGTRADLQEVIENLEAEARALRLVGREREIQNQVIQIQDNLNRQLADSEIVLLESTLRNVELARERAQVLDSIIGPQQELNTQLQALNTLQAEGAISGQQYGSALRDIQTTQAQLNIDAGQGTFADGFILQFDRIRDAAENFRSETGSIFGEFFNSTIEGFSRATAEALLFGGSIRDAIGNVARQALTELLSGLIRIGLQFAVNAAIGQTLGAAATTAAVTQAGILSAAFATPAALASLSSFGANAAPANAAIAGTVAFSQGLASIPGFQTGGQFMVGGAGGPDSQLVQFRATPGERVSIETPTQQSNGEGTPSQGNGDVRILNVIDPNMVEDFLTSTQGERVLVNVIERNSSTINTVLSG